MISGPAIDLFRDDNERIQNPSIYLGNLSFNANETDIRDAFAAFGTVEKAAVITDKGTGQSRGFGSTR